MKMRYDAMEEAVVLLITAIPGQEIAVKDLLVQLEDLGLEVFVGPAMSGSFGAWEIYIY